MGVELSPERSVLDDFARARRHDFARSSTSSSSTSSSSASSRSRRAALYGDDAVFRTRRHHHRRPSDQLLRKPPTMRAFAQDGSFAFTDAAVPATGLTHGGQRRKRVPPPASSLRDLESATSVLEATRRMELARQRSHVSFGKRTIDLDKTFRTAPGGRSKISLDSPPHSPQRTGRASSASFMTPAQVIYAASTGGSSSYVSTTSSSGSGSSGSGASRSLSRQATLRAIAKGSGAASDDSFASTGGSSVSSLFGSSPSSGSAAAILAAKQALAKKNVSFPAGARPGSSNHTEAECAHDHASSSSTSVATMLSPIHAACRKGDYLVVKHVLSFYYGNECVNLVNSSCTCGMTSLQVACDHGHVKIAKLLLRRHAQPNKRGSKKRHHTCLAMASMQNNVELAELLLQYGATVDDDALSIAASAGYADMVRLFVNFRPKRSGMGFDLATPLFQKTSATTSPSGSSSGEIDASALVKAAALAVMQDHAEMLAILLGDGKVQASRAKVMACALDAAVSSDHRLLRSLAKRYDHGLLLETKDASACSLLHHAVRNENVKSVMLLVRLGADVNARDGGGITPLYIACARGHSSIVRILVDAGAKCVSMGPNDESPLHIAAQENHLACVELLLAHGQAQVDGLTRDRCTALHLACQRGNTQVASVLLEHGADVNALTVSDETPLLKASRMSQLQTVKLLVAHGATTHAKDARRAKDRATDEVAPGLRVDENHNSSNATAVRSKAKKAASDESIFIAKTNTHTSLKKWIRSVLKNDK